MKTIASILMFLAIPLSAASAPESAPDADALMRTQQTTPTARLLELQRSGKVASRHEQTLPGKAQSKIYERYINSFGFPIPQTYISEDFSE